MSDVSWQALQAQARLTISKAMIDPASVTAAQLQVAFDVMKLSKDEKANAGSQ